MQDKIISMTPISDDEGMGDPLRPQRLDSFVGQREIVDNLHVYIDAAKARGEPLDPVLFNGPPGIGKTTLARILANEMGAHIHITSGPAIRNSAEMAYLLTKVKKGDVVFIDEIHATNVKALESAYSAITDGIMDIVTGSRDHPEVHSMKIPAFTLIGATTRVAKLPAPLRDRFGIQETLSYYMPDELSVIVDHSATILNVKLDPGVAAIIGQSARGVPRIANRLLRRVRDFAMAASRSTVDPNTVHNAMERMGIDHLGLTIMDRKMMRIVINDYSTKPIGLSTIASEMSESPQTIEEVFEPYMIQTGLLQKTAMGRLLTPRGIEHLRLLGELPPKPDSETEARGDIDGKE